jgi:hypothetical protein
MTWWKLNTNAGTRRVGKRGYRAIGYELEGEPENDAGV